MTSSSVVKTSGEQTKNPSSSNSSSSAITQENEPNETTPSFEPEQVKPASKQIKKQLSVQPQIQTVWNYCAPTTVSMMLSSQGVHVGQKQLAFEMRTYEPFGTHNSDAIRILNKHLFGYEYPTDGQAGYRLATVTDPNTAGQEIALFKQRVRENIDAGYPMYYTFDSAVMYPSKKGSTTSLVLAI
ncbi:C39 family peptidase [Streptococcus sp. A22]|uniref:C39 family peptidase n=1 Tax=Streptococcus sp. A22 TaxID=3373126 RepID=UPI00374DFA76